MASYNRTINDSTGVSDSVQRSWVAIRSFTHEGILGSILVPSGTLTPGGTLIPGAGTYSISSDAVVRQTSWIRNPAETLTTRDTQTRSFRAPRVDNEVLITNDTISLRSKGTGKTTYDTLTSSQSVSDSHGSNRLFSETLSPSTFVSRGFNARRSNLDGLFGLTSSVTNITYKRQRITLETLRALDTTLSHFGTHLSFTISENYPVQDTNTSTLYHRNNFVRSLTESLVSAQGLVSNAHKVVHFALTLTESLSILDSLSRSARTQRSVVDMLVPGQIGLPLLFTAPIINRDSATRVTQYVRYDQEALTAGQILSRNNTVHRSASESVPFINNTLYSSGGHPRSTREYTSVLDSSSYQLLAPVLGSIWFNPSTNIVIGQLPDWGFVLIEDPQAGNGLFYDQTPTWSLNPQRTK